MFTGKRAPPPFLSHANEQRPPQYKHAIESNIIITLISNGGISSRDIAGSSERHRRPVRGTISLGASLPNIEITRESPAR